MNWEFINELAQWIIMGLIVYFVNKLADIVSRVIKLIDKLTGG